ncbi:acyltransferase family protein [Granulicella sibirica]|uniref:Acyltransferase family protein n=1 Tax=Granulicella sibirica TaxID=2479048 RepID=A0A4Q0SW27_9BACT|nr:acyltransferase [Granulicella sibirica]RXH55315.1 acyltransferase family protein [Granulicella sibirica]
MQTMSSATDFLPPAPAVAVPEDAENPGGFAHVPALDGVRGLAILLVLFDHLFWANNVTGNRLLDVMSDVRESSYIGVNLFFALSGFLITGILLDTLATPHFLRTFYARRSLRIFPLYYGVLILLLALTRPMHFEWNGWQYFYLTYTANLGLWHGGLGLGAININHFWSLQVEEQFYLIWPFVVYRVRSLTWLIRLSLMACAGVLALRIGLVLARPHLVDPYVMYSPTYACADNLLFGCCLCAVLRTGLREKVLRISPWVAGSCVAVLLGMALGNDGLRWQKSFSIPTFGFSLLGVLSAALIAMTLRKGSPTQAVFRNPALRFFGKYSYGLYVFHPTIARYLTVPVRAFVDAEFHSKALGVLAGALIAGVASVLVALLSYHLYEVHFLKLKKHISYGT